MRTFVALGVALILAVPAPRANGCAIPRHLKDRVTIDSEDALIIWDPASKTEHFIRRANFNTDAKDFGFLVPTPTKPELAEAEDMIFPTLADVTRPRVEYVKRKVQRGRDHAGAAAASKAAAPESKVDILGKARVAGYDAVILKATDAQELQAWLAKHGYASSPELTEWLQWYTDHGWIITAFKLSNQASASDRFAGRTVRMSFRTETPFYPYREPADMRPKEPGHGRRTLRVYFLSDKRYDGTLGKAGVWPGKAVWANELGDYPTQTVFNRIGLDGKAREALTAKKWHLTEIEDTSFPRPGTDEVYFKVADNQETLEKPPIVYTIDEYVDGPVNGVDQEWGVWAVFGFAAVTIVGLIAYAIWRLKPAA